MNISYDYDFKLQFKELQQGNPVLRLLEYRLMKGNVDCDVSELTMTVFQNKFEYLSNHKLKPTTKPNLYRLELQSGAEVRGDTMTSFHTSFKEYLKLFHSDLLDEKGQIPRAEWLNASAETHDWTRYAKKLIGMDKLDLIPEMQRFIEVYHTIGNLTPVPENFNVERSNFGRYDYWDLTLLAIYHWYCKSSQLYIDDVELSGRDLLYKMFRGNKTSIQKTEQWLVQFPTWNEFVVKNYFQDFVSKDDQSNYSEPIMFWEGHSFDRPIPELKEDMLLFLSNVTKMITARGKKIL